MKLCILTALAGAAVLLLCFCSSRSQMLRRRETYRRRFGTRLVNIRTGGFVDLAAGHYVMGRQRFKCDIALDDLNDPTVSRIHAVLFWDGSSYCIAPARPDSPFARPSYPNVYIRRSGAPRIRELAAPTDGCKLHPGDVIRLGESEFTLVPGKEERYE